MSSEEKTQRWSWKAELILLIYWTGDSDSQHMLHQTQNVCVFFPCIISALLWSYHSSAAVPMRLLGEPRCGTTDVICTGMLGRSLCRELSLDGPICVFMHGPQKENLWEAYIGICQLCDFRWWIYRKLFQAVYFAKVEFAFYCNPVLGKKYILRDSWMGWFFCPLFPQPLS